MKTKIVYVLVSSKADFYLEQTLISVYSCRLHNSEANITIVLDRDTSNSLKASRSEIKKYATELIVADIPSEYNNMQKSRYLKTSLRSIVEGDFLYVDSDTVISDSLSEIDQCEFDIAAVYDSNRPFLISDSGYTSDSYILYHTKSLGWPSVIGYPNYNGGVIYSKDSRVSHTFFERWHELWVECTKLGTNIDMAALCRANIELDCCIKELSGIWNCQIQRQGLPLLPDAKIIHCFTGGNVSEYVLCSDMILNKMKVIGKIDSEIDNYIHNAKTAFFKSTTIVSSEEANLLSAPVVKLSYSKPRLFVLLNKIVSRLLL